MRKISHQLKPTGAWIPDQAGVTSFKNRFENQPKSIDLTLLSFEFFTLSRIFLLTSDRKPFRIVLHVKDAPVGCFKINLIKGLYSKCLHVISRIPTVKLKIPVKAFLKFESRTSVTFKL